MVEIASGICGRELCFINHFSREIEPYATYVVWLAAEREYILALCESPEFTLCHLLVMIQGSVLFSGEDCFLSHFDRHEYYSLSSTVGGFSYLTTHDVENLLSNVPLPRELHRRFGIKHCNVNST